MTIPLPDDAVVHRIGGADVSNLRLKPQEVGLTPPGLSLLTGGTPAEAAEAIRTVYARSRKWRPPLDVGSAAVADIGRPGST